MSGKDEKIRKSIEFQNELRDLCIKHNRVLWPDRDMGISIWGADNLEDIENSIRLMVIES